MSLRPFLTPLPDAPLPALEIAWERSDALFGWLDRALAGGSLGEWTRVALLARPIALREPFVFYLGHLPAFAWDVVGRGLLGLGAFDERFADFDEIFLSGGDTLGRTAEPSPWPDIVRVLTYRYGVRSEIRDRVGELAAAASDDGLAAEAWPGAGLRVLHLLLEHELTVQEALMTMVQAHELGALRAEPLLHEVDTGRSVDERGPDVVRVHAGNARLGADFASVPFAWDVALPFTAVAVQSFRIARQPVSNGDWRRFVAAGGYQESRLWDPGDLEWLASQGRQGPANWHQRQASHWVVRAPFVEVPLDEAEGWPVQVSQVEATAYARWMGARLPTEAELHRAAYGDDDRPHPWGRALPSHRHGAFGWRPVGPTPVGSRPAGRSELGVDELVGNGWEWTSTPLGPLPGYRPRTRTAPGTTADPLDGEHVVVFGASWATDPRLLRRSFRQGLRRRDPWSFTKFRLAWDG